jgi:hypothetical protein
LVHPIRDTDRIKLRHSLAELLKKNYDLVRHGSIVFVCGGNEPNHARTRFLEIAPAELPDYDLFTPEIALKELWRDGDGPFELTGFEELLAEVSAAIVVFPESPGSFCETGYFSAKENILSKTLLAINQEFQGEDSFISAGPLHLINAHSHFRPTEFIDYGGDFNAIISRIKKRKPIRHREPVRVTGLVVTPQRKVSLGRDRERMIKALMHKAISGNLEVDRLGELAGYLNWSKSADPEFVTSLRAKYGDQSVNAFSSSRMNDLDANSV